MDKCPKCGFRTVGFLGAERLSGGTKADNVGIKCMYCNWRVTMAALQKERDGLQAELQRIKDDLKDLELEYRMNADR